MFKPTYLQILLLSVVNILPLSHHTDTEDIDENADTENVNEEEFDSDDQYSNQTNDTIYYTDSTLNNTSSEQLHWDDLDFEGKLRRAQIIPDILSSAPPEILKVTFKSGDLEPGQTLRLLDVWDQPNITYVAEPNSYYTIFLSCIKDYFSFSYESESKPESLEMGQEHATWLVINIPETNIPDGKSLYHYAPPHRLSEKQVVDRYTFLLYKQRYKIRDDRLPEPENGDFYLPGEIKESSAFAFDHKLGEPIAANFFIMHW